MSPETVAPVVKTTTGVITASGMWTLVGMVAIALIGLGKVVLPKWWENTFSQRKDDVERLGDRVAVLEQEITKERDARVGAQMQLSYLVAAFGMVSSELERQDPGNMVIRQARAMVAQATHKDNAFGDLVANLDTVRGVGEK